MRSTHKTLLLIIVLLWIAPAFAQDVTLSWDPSPTDGVTGYNVYYKADDMSFPFNGTGADQGNSPVDVGDTLSTTLTGLSDGVSYFFTVTAYDNSANQSTYSNIVSNDWIPSLQTPANGAQDEPVPVTFQWDVAPSGYSVTYTLFYGTDSQEVTEATTDMAWTAPFSGPTLIETLLWLGGFSIVVLFVTPQASRKRTAKFAGLLILTFSILTACGGGGGGGSDSSSTRTATTVDEPDAVLYALDKGSSDYHQAFDLEAGTTYYWKIVATDTNDSTLEYESQLQSFTTEAF